MDNMKATFVKRVGRARWYSFRTDFFGSSADAYAFVAAVKTSRRKARIIGGAGWYSPGFITVEVKR